jgi:hypothetical protein
VRSAAERSVSSGVGELALVREDLCHVPVLLSLLIAALLTLVAAAVSVLTLRAVKPSAAKDKCSKDNLAPMLSPA